MVYKLINGDFVRTGVKRNPKLLYIHTHRRNRIKWGKANKCVNKNCLQQSKRFEYALVKGKQHGEVKENYIELCHKCHTNYDRKPDYQIVL